MLKSFVVRCDLQLRLERCIERFRSLYVSKSFSPFELDQGRSGRVECSWCLVPFRALVTRGSSLKALAWRCLKQSEYNVVEVGFVLKWCRASI